MNVLIENRHMKGNSWHHDDNGSGRMCPLYEALKEMLPDSRLFVGATTVEIDNKLYTISSNWAVPLYRLHGNPAIEHIEKAQTDENYTVNIELIESNYWK